jgi:ribonuclease HI
MFASLILLFFLLSLFFQVSPVQTCGLQACPTSTPACPSVTMSVPTHSACTYNLRGVHFKDKKAGARLKKESNILSLTNSNDFSFFQETRLGPVAKSYLKKLLPGCGVYTSSLSFKSCGVATVLSPSIVASFDVVTVALPPSLLGRALVLRLVPKAGDGPSLVLVNVYLQSGDNYGLKTDQIALLSRLVPSSPFMYLGGDFNFVENKARDTSSSSDYYDPTVSFLDTWTDFKLKFGFKEVVQLSHTYFDVGKDVTDCRSSRLDRLYISHSEADWAVVRPFAYISTIPHSVLGSVSRDDKGTDCAVGVSDHLPVALRFAPQPLVEGRRDPSIPRWVAEHPDFKRYFDVRWSSRAIYLDPTKPFAVCDVMKECMFAASADVLADRRGQTKVFGTQVAELTFMVKALRCHNDPDSDFSLSFFARNPGVGGPVQVRARITELLGKAGVEETIGDDNPAVTVRSNKALDKVKLCLPSTRIRLSALRPDLDSDPTSDPDAMTQLAVAHWAPIWAARNKEECIEPDVYYGDFSLTIPGSLLPILPSVDHVRDAIEVSKNSCFGPDGIPFAAWRAIVDHAVPVLHGVLEALCRGVLPPEGYNHGLLFLIPKKGTLLPSDTRPISVTNADNRILAKAVVSAITPALLATLHHSQKGFVKGRAFEDHIRELNERFYEIAEDEDRLENLFILFMDTAKAFDSIDHDFIHVAIRRTGLPGWFSSLVRGLLHGAAVKTTFKGAKNVWIPIGRGVKQGCPLSPLLFVICYDILLRHISDLEDADPHACADDLAVASGSYLRLWPVMRLVDAFRAASGLGINTDKTRIVSARPSDIDRCFNPVTILDRLNRCPWPDALEAVDYTYLGILFGRLVTVPDVYRVSVKGLVDRAITFRPFLHCLSHASRVLAYNTFIITKVSYLVKFFHIPFSQRPSAGAEGIIKAQARSLLLPVRAAYHYQFLVAPPSITSPGPPITDAWALSMSVLVDQCDLMQWDGLSNDDIDIDDGDVHTMRISVHIQSAGGDFAFRVTRCSGLPFDANAFDLPSGGARRKAIYWWLIKTDYEADLGSALEDVLTRRGLSHCDKLVPVLHTNFSLLPRNFPSHYRCTQFEIITNCLYDGRRFNKVDGAVPQDCFLCGRGPDSAQHLFGGYCEVAVAARCIVPHVLRRYSARGRAFPSLDPEVLGAAHYWASSLLAFPRPGFALGSAARKAAVFAMSLFNGVLWYERTYYFRLLSSPPQVSQATDRLASMVAIEFHRVRAGVGGGTGKAVARKRARKEAARALAVEAIQSLGPRTLVGFTDGSANPNPGPAGAGAFVYSTTPSDTCSLEAIAALGEGTNNLGELWAIGMAVQLALRHIAAHPPGTYTHYQGFTDSALSRCWVLGIWESKKYKALVEAVALCLTRLAVFVIVSIDWVPAHVGIDENEHADFLAGRGTLLSRAGRTNVNAQEDFKTGDFLPP